MARLARINIHPVKSLDPQSVAEVVVLAGGALAHDRRFAVRDRQGQFVNAKRTPAAHLLRSNFDPAANRLKLEIDGTGVVHAFDVDAQRREIGRWLSEYFAMSVELAEDPLAGFPDDTESPGPTVISVATLTTVAGWFGGLSQEEIRRRFRANLEIDDVEPFWEDRLVPEDGKLVRFRVGPAEFFGTNPCQRCPVPTRNSYTGEATREFAKIFSRHRQATLPAWAPAARFDHFYRLATNTRAAGSEEVTIRVGDEVVVLGVV